LANSPNIPPLLNLRRSGSMRLIGLTIGLIIFIPNPTFAETCVNPPKGLNSRQLNVVPDTIPFVHARQNYTIDIYSSYAPQKPTASNPRTREEGTPWCLRYEVENTSSLPISLFSWHVAGAQLQKPLLASKERQSWAITRDKTPTVGESIIFAFKEVALRGRAYQSTSSNDDSHTKYAMTTHPALISPLVYSRTDMPAARTINALYLERLLAKEPTKFPTVGGDFSGSKVEVSVGSQAWFDGKTYTFSVILDVSSDTVKEVSAPFLAALAVSKTPEMLLNRLVETAIAEKPLQPFGQKQYLISTEISVEAMPMRYLYVVDQPITISAFEGPVCFSVPSYSPVPIPSGMLRCKLAPF
jgi:hypothetical protein